MYRNNQRIICLDIVSIGYYRRERDSILPGLGNPFEIRLEVSIGSRCRVLSLARQERHFACRHRFGKAQCWIEIHSLDRHIVESDAPLLFLDPRSEADSIHIDEIDEVRWLRKGNGE